MQDAHTSFPRKKKNPKSCLCSCVRAAIKRGRACYSEIIPQILFFFWCCASSWCPLQRLCGLVWPQPKPHFHPFRRAGCAQLSFKSRLVLRKCCRDQSQRGNVLWDWGLSCGSTFCPKIEPGGIKGCCKPLWRESNSSDAFLGGLWYSSKCLTAGEVEVGSRSSCEAMVTLWMLFFSFFALDYWLF